MEITSPELSRVGAYFKLTTGPLFMCLEPFEEVFKIPYASSYWVRASSKKPKGRNYARAVLSKVENGYWKWKILGFKIDGYGEYFLSGVSPLLNKHFPNGGTHYLYFWILYR